MSAYHLIPPDRLSKSFTITGPGDLTLEVDYDDVNRDEVLADARELVAVMNSHYDLREHLADDA